VAVVATVELEPWSPASDDREEIDRVASRSPADWTIVFGLGEAADDDCASVMVMDAAGKLVKGGRDGFKSYRFDQVAPFLETVLSSLERSR
jgi:hypothetical protein